MKHAVTLQNVGICLGIVLVAFSTARLIAQQTKPPLRTAAFFENQTRAAMLKPMDDVAAWVSMSGDVLSDIAMTRARQSLETASNASDHAALNNAAQSATVAALTVSPINPMAWLVLGQLKTQNGEPATASLKMSYFTGTLPPNALAARLRSVVTTSAAIDEETTLLAQSDVRSILTKYGNLEPALAATYRQATAEGKKFLLTTIQTVDPRFSKLLQQYP